MTLLPHQKKLVLRQAGLVYLVISMYTVFNFVGAWVFTQTYPAPEYKIAAQVSYTTFAVFATFGLLIWAVVFFSLLVENWEVEE